MLVTTVFILTHPVTSNAGVLPHYLNLVLTGEQGPVAGAYYLKISVSPTSSNLTTYMFRTDLSNRTNGGISVGSAPSTCTPDSEHATPRFSANICGYRSGTWYDVLVYENGTIANVYSSPGQWIGPSAVVTDSMTFYLVSNLNLTRSGDNFGPVGINGFVVAGGLNV